MARFRISAVSSISTIKVLLSLNRSSLAPILENSLSTIPIVAAPAGTKEPICARMAIRAVCRRKVDFPAMFGPVMTCILPASEWSETELGVKTRPHIKRPTSTDGCRPLVISYTLLESPSFLSWSFFFGQVCERDGLLLSYSRFHKLEFTRYLCKGQRDIQLINDI